MNFYSILAYVTTTSVLVPTLISLIKYKSLNNSLRLLFVYLVITCFKEAACIYLALKLENNIHIYNALSIVEFFIIPYIYYKEFTSIKFKNITKYAIIITSIVYLTNVLFIQGLFKFNTYTIIAGRLSLITITLLYFFELLQKVETTSLYKEPMLWVTTGVLFYSVGSFLVHGLYDLHSQFPMELNLKIWAINSVLNFMMNILFSISFLCADNENRNGPHNLRSVD